MQIHRISYGIRGFGRITSYAIRYTRMVTNKAKHKAQVLAFWTKHGLEATLDAFSVKKRTLYYWQAQLKKGGGQLEALNDKSRKPQKKTNQKNKEAQAFHGHSSRALWFI